MANKEEIIERAKRIQAVKKRRLERERAVFMKLGAKLRAYLFTGILVTAPVAITFYLAYKAIFWVDSFVNRLLPPQYQLDNYLPMTIPGLGLIVLILFLMIIGMFAAGFLGRFFIRLGEWVVGRMPLISSVYSLLKQIFETVFSSKTQAFKKVVMLEYPRKGIWILGLVSADLKGEVETKLPVPMLNVFVPTTPNPTSGFLIFVPKTDVIELDMSVEEAIKFIVSGGLVEPNNHQKC
jgi:uncharacterized membrane protein